MERRQLKILIASGGYRPEPARVAQAMLRRRALRTLLTAYGSAGRAVNSIGPAGRIPPTRESPRRAA